jgi:hypothetical protein
MNNRLLEEVEYRVVETGFGVWRSYGYESGQFYHEFTSHSQVAGLSLAALFGVGQFATGYAAIGQFGLGKYVLGQAGLGKYVWSMSRADPEAIEFFKSLPIISWFLPLPSAYQ